MFRTLCMPLCAHVELVTPVRHTKEDSVLPSWFDSRHTFVTPGIMKRIFSAKCGCARAILRPLRSSAAVLPSGPLLHLSTIATEYFTSHGRTGRPPGNSLPKRLTKQATLVRTASFTSFTALSANPPLCESYRALSFILTVTPANFNAVAADAFRARMAGSLSDLRRTSAKPLQTRRS